MVAPVEHHHLVLLRASEELFARAFAHPFHQHLVSLSDAPRVALRAQLVLQGNQLLQPPHLLLLRHVVRQVARGISAGPFAVLEHEGRVVPAFAHERERKLVVLLRFRAVAGKDVRGQAAIGHDAPNGRHAVQVPLAGIFAVHEFENAVRAALYGQVDMAAHVRLLGDDAERIIAHVLRV